MLKSHLNNAKFTQSRRKMEICHQILHSISHVFDFTRYILIAGQLYFALIYSVVIMMTINI